ncbi:hypothetical protein Acr_00g0059440 [Actinidia rufa]|uniref:Uncharacterized protein n=1 Tax=Actinidia rufa TaxID=165716 RepID=A0A7J0DN40_9ERIC|nr:hypothetical protein Acr_00g0059440 [Actinidia rufa]
MDLKKRKRGVTVKCGGSLPEVGYEMSFCLCIATREDASQPIEWYTLDMLSKRDKNKKEEEKQGEHLSQIPTPEHRGAHFTFHHKDRCRRRGNKPPPMLPLITELKKEHSEVEVKDRNLVEVESEGKWSPLAGTQSALGFEDLYAATIDDEQYSGKILVGSIPTGATFLYDVLDNLWASFGFIKFQCPFFSPPIVVGTTVSSIRFIRQDLYAYDFVKQTSLSMPIEYHKISQLICHTSSWDGDRMDPCLRHLGGDIFCLVWTGASASLHCTKLRVSTTGITGASVLSGILIILIHKIWFARLPTYPAFSKVSAQLLVLPMLVFHYFAFVKLFV